LGNFLNETSILDSELKSCKLQH